MAEASGLALSDKAPSTARLTPAPPVAPAPATANETGVGRTGSAALERAVGFIENRGEEADDVAYYARAGRQSVWITNERVVFDLLRGAGPSLERLVFSQDLVGATSDIRVRGEQLRSGTVSVFRGSDPSNWRADLPSYGRVVFRDAWDGIDVRLSVRGDDLEEDFIVSPRADPSQIVLAYRGVKRLDLAPDGSLIIRTRFGDLREDAPVVYQMVGGRRVPVPGEFRLLSSRRYTFEVGAYDWSRELVIDPTISYSTYLGGSGDDQATGVAVDPAGNVYVAGHTQSTDFPTENGFQTTLGSGDSTFGRVDAFVTKLDASGSERLWSTYLGGDSLDEATAIAVDGQGQAVITGRTRSLDLPVKDAFRSTKPSREVSGFATKLAAAGDALVYSSYVLASGPVQGRAIAVDGAGSAYLTGSVVANDFPTTAGAFDTTYNGGSGFGEIADVFVTKISPGGALVYSTYLGGGSDEVGTGIAVTADGAALVAGSAREGFPTTAGAFQSQLGGFPAPEGPDAFVSKLDPAGTQLEFSTYVGGRGTDSARGIAVGPNGNAYLTGVTGSTDFPTVNPLPGGAAVRAADGFAAQLNAGGSALVYSTYLGGSGSDAGAAIAVDGRGNAYVTGSTDSTDFPTSNPVQASAPFPFGTNPFVSKLSATGSSLRYSTYYGGTTRPSTAAAVAATASGVAHVAGHTADETFPTTPFAADRGYNGGQFDAFAFSLVDDIDGIVVTGILPGDGGNTGSVTATIHGNGFLAGATAKLVGGAEIAGVSETVASDGRSMSAVFDLAGQPPGPRDIVVMNPDGDSAMLPNAFLITEGGGPDVWVDIVGRPVASPRGGKFSVIVGNRGETDAVGVPLLITGVPDTAQFATRFEVQGPPPPHDFPAIFRDRGQHVAPFLVPVLPPGASMVLEFYFQTAQRVFEVGAEVLPPLADSVLDFIVDNRECILELGREILELAAKPSSPEYENKLEPELSPECFQDLATVVTQLAPKIAEGALSIARESGSPILSLTETLVLSTTVVLQNRQLLLDSGLAESCVTELGLIALTRLAPAVVPLVEGALAALALHEKFVDCRLDRLKRKLGIEVLTAFDPNDKFGAIGVGQARYLRASEPLRYAIAFENIDTATAPAQEVVVTDRLDPAALDLDTLSLGPIVFGDTQVVPPPGLSSYTTEVDLRPARDLFVRVSAALDRTTGVLTWRLLSVDPSTGELPEDPLSGFLPPNGTPPEGEGTVNFTVMPRAGLPTGAEIRNSAEIIFDVNAPISTSTWLNTIDATPPASQVRPLSIHSPTEFTVEWSGTDEGAGVLDYTVFVSEDGGTFEPWLRNTGLTSSTFTGQEGRTYSFYTVARDRAGNREPAPDAADTRTTVASRLIPPASLGQFASDGTTAIPVGGSALGTTVVFAGNVSSPAGREVRLEVEAKLTGSGFDGTGLASSALTPSGGRASVTVPNLAFGGYHWRARTVDASGAESDWVTFGDNAETEDDLQVLDEILFASARTGHGDIYAIESGGGMLRQLTSGNAIDSEPVWSPDRAKLAFTSGRDGNVEIYVTDADGSDVTRLTTDSAIDTSPDWSPDGSKIAFASSRARGNWDIYVMDAADGANVTRLTTHGAADTFPTWSPDGTKIAFSSARTGGTDIYTMDANGAFQTRRTTASGVDTEAAWFGSTIAFSTNRHGSTNFEIYTMDEDGTGQTRRTIRPGSDVSPAWSPGATKIAFATNRAGNFDIFTMNADGSQQTPLTTHPALDALPDW